ncbi:plexin-C1-like [Sander vitreus]
MDCTPQESPVWNNTGVKLTYRSSPSCTHIVPSSTWISGKRKITLMGSHLEFVEGVMHSHAPQEVRPPRNGNNQSLTYDTPAAEKGISTSTVFLKVANETLACLPMTYYPEPEFTSFTSTKTGDDVRITIQKKADKLEMTIAELEVWGVEEEKQHPCIMVTKETSNRTDFFTCKIQRTANANFQQLMIKYGDKTVTLRPPCLVHLVLNILRFLLIPCIMSVLVAICLWQRKLTAKTNKLGPSRQTL